MEMPQKFSRLTRLSEPVYQYSLFDQSRTEKVVNVASVPQRSPFRYPGGKTWLVPRLRQWLRSLPVHPQEFIEPFAGGGIASLTVAFEELASHVTMVEIDAQVAAVWQTILSENRVQLAEEISSFPLSAASVQEVLEQPDTNTSQIAFKTLLKNRVVHGGILAPGSGLLKHGENGKGIASRWYPQTLRRRILDIAAVQDKISFVWGDGLELLRQNAHREDAAFFIDPPYTAAGKRAGSRLYTHSELDHEELFRLVEKLAGPVLMTYDNAPEVAEMARQHGFQVQAIPMKNTHHAAMTELLISRNLCWNGISLAT